MLAGVAVGISSRSSDLEATDVERILDTARALERSLDREMKKLPTLRGRLVINLFYESSTRTLSSFDLAAKRLSADTMALRSSGSSVDKGESLRDTALTLAEYDPDVIVIRHPHIGAPDADRPGDAVRTSSTRVTGSTSTRRRRCSTSTRCARRSAASTGSTWPSWATSCTRASRAR